MKDYYRNRTSRSVFDCVRALSVPSDSITALYFVWVCMVCVGHHDSAPVVIMPVVSRCQFGSFVCVYVSRTVRVSVGNTCLLYSTAYIAPYSCIV